MSIPLTLPDSIKLDGYFSLSSDDEEEDGDVSDEDEIGEEK